MDLSIFKNKKVLVTGHTGFKGAWLTIWLKQLGAEVSGISLGPTGAENLFEASGIGEKISDHRADIRCPNHLKRIFASEQPEVVFHLAAQPLVIESYHHPVETFSINAQGTANVLEAIRQTPSVRAAVMVTTDKCYENKEWAHGYRECDALGGHDPYSASKAAAEIIIASYRRSFFEAPNSAAIASARAGNVIGGGDWAAYRLVPDIISAVEQGRVLDIRNPAAVRPWQHVLEPLCGYLLLAARMLDKPGQYDEAWNFGPMPENVLPVKDMVTAFLRHFGRGEWRDVSDPSQLHEAGLLMLDINKAIHRLGWKPVLRFEETIEWTASWYADYRQAGAARSCEEQINQYTRLWKSRNEKPRVSSKSRLLPA